jgi:hypothetical protein
MDIANTAQQNNYQNRAEKLKLIKDCPGGRVQAV